MSGDICTDDRFELIAKAKAKLLGCTNIESSPNEVAVLDSILFRCWQMGWLDNLREDNSRAEMSYEDALILLDELGLSERTCHWELKHSGTLYDKWRCSKCGYLHVESRIDGGATDLDPNYCPNCGAKVEQ